MATLISDLLTDALTDLGQLGEGQSPSPEQINRAMRYANRRLQTWSLQRFLLYTIGTRKVSLTPLLQDYTMGPSAAGPGAFVGTRPVFVESAQVALPGSANANPLNFLDKTKWGAIQDLGATCSASGLPQDIFIEFDYPNIQLHFWTIPANAAQLTLATWDQLQQFVSPFDEVNLPPGYELLIQKSVAVDLAPAYDMPVSQDLQSAANDAMVQVMKNNAQKIGGALGDSQLLNAPNLAIPPQTGGQ